MRGKSKTETASGGLYLSQGMLATVLAVPVTVAAGMFSGDVLRRTEWSGDRRAGMLAVIGGGLMTGGDGEGPHPRHGEKLQLLSPSDPGCPSNHRTNMRQITEQMCVKSPNMVDGNKQK